MMRSAVVPVLILGACALAGGALLAQGPRNIQPLALEDRAGFEPMFDGSSGIGGLEISVDWNTRISPTRASRAATAPISGLSSTDAIASLS